MLLNAFLKQCALQPDALVMVEAERSISYRDCLNRAQTIAAELQTRGLNHQPIAIYLERGIDAAIAIFGVLLAGGCYVPLDLKNPSARLAFIVSDAQVGAVLGLGTKPNWLDESLWLNINECVGWAMPTLPKTESIAAILYTSGSTGQPRGVALSHGAILAFTQWAADLLTLNAQDRIASSAPFFFDLSTFDLYAALGAGATLYFMPPMLTLSPARLSAWLQEHRITGWYTVPSLLAFLAYKGNLSQTPLPNLRFLLFAGEVFPTPALISLSDALPNVALYNFFGPTETNVCCFWQVQRETLNPEQPIPIGNAAADCQLKIAEHELWVRGSTLASGYWQQGKLQPFLNNESWYATGDKVSLVNGQYHFHGRLGRMLKCSGFRVEPAEIEAVVNAVDGVLDCAVVGINDTTAGQRPALAVVLNGLTIAELRKTLSQQLPPYMQPSRYLVLETLPRLANGKLDYQQLQTLFNQTNL